MEHACCYYNNAFGSKNAFWRIPVFLKLYQSVGSYEAASQSNTDS